MEKITNLSTFGAMFTLAMGVLLIFLPRRYAVAPMVMATCFITIGQQVNILGAHFTIVRILVLLGWIRVILKGEIKSLRLNAIDYTLLFWVASSVVVPMIREPTTDVLNNRMGLAYNATGLFFLFRSVIRDMGDVERVIKIISVVIIPLALAMIIESMTGRNIFAVFGGVPEFTVVREGQLRCQGSFRSPILAGTFAATLLPLFISLWFSNRCKNRFAIFGFISASIITVTSSSSGPVSTYILGLIAFLFWRLRRNMREVRWIIAISLGLLHFVIMKAPVWYLIAKISTIIGGTGWHRSYLIDQAIKYFNEWWLIGTSYTAHWMPYAQWNNPNMADITNQFISEGVGGGLITMLLFILLIVYCFRKIGVELPGIERHSKSSGLIVWGMGISLFSHVMSFLSVTYFDQIIVIWYLLLAMISSLEGQGKRPYRNQVSNSVAN